MRTERSLTLGPAAVVIVAAIGADVLLSACGGGVGPTALPTTTTTERTTVTITANGLVPGVVTVPVCRGWCFFVVQIVNEDTVAHDMQSDPHPEHTGCLRFNTTIGRIEPGQSKEVEITGCDLSRFGAFHDDTRLDDPRFQARIRHP